MYFIEYVSDFIQLKSSWHSLSACHSYRSPSTPELSADELPDEITNEMPDIPNDLELNQEDFSDVLPRLPDDLQDFDLFEGTFTSDYMTTKYDKESRVASFDFGQQEITKTSICQSTLKFSSKNLLARWLVCTLSEFSLWIQVRMESCCPPQRRQRSWSEPCRPWGHILTPWCVCPQWPN